MLVVAFLGVLACIAVYASIDFHLTIKEHAKQRERDATKQAVRDYRERREIERELGISRPALTSPVLRVTIEVQASVV